MARVDVRKLGVVFRREYLERVRSRWFLIGTLLGPVFFAAVTVLPVMIAATTKPSTTLADVVIIDATGTVMGERVAAALRERFPLSPAPRVRAVAGAGVAREEARATAQVQRRELLGYLVLDSGSVAGRSARYAGRNAGSMGDVEQITSIVRQQVMRQRLTAEGIDAARVQALTGERLSVATEKISDKGHEQGSGKAAAILGYVVAYLLFMMITLYGQQILRGVMEEKTTRVAEVVVSSVSTDTLLAGKILGVGLVAVTQVLAWAALSVVFMLRILPGILARYAPPGADGATSASAIAAALPSLPLPTAAALLAFFVLGFIFYASLFAAVGAMVGSQEDVQQATMPVTLLLISTVIFMAPVMANPTSALSRTMSLVPFSAPILMPLRMTLVPVPWYEVAGALAGVVLACVAAIWLSARIYRVGLLMYGKRPSLGELARWIRYAG